MTEGFITESTEFLEKLVYSSDRIKTLDDTFSKKSDQKDEKHHFYRLLTLQTKHGFSQKKDAKALAAEVDKCSKMNGNKKEGWATKSVRVNNLLLRQNIIDFKSTTAPNKKKTIQQIKSILHKNLTNDLIPPEQKEEKLNKVSTSLDKQLNTQKLLKKKWDEINARKTKDDNVKKHFEPLASWTYLCVQKMNNAQVASFLDLMENESTKMKDNVTLLPFFKQDLEGNKTVFGSRPIHNRIIARDMELLGKNSKILQSDERFLSAWASKLAKVTDANPQYNDDLRSKYLTKLKKWMDTYVKGNSPSLKSLILYNLLQDHERQGKYDKDLFKSYLAVPKKSKYNKNLGNTKKWKSKQIANLSYSINNNSLYPVIDDTKLVYRYFRNIFKKKDEKIKNWIDVADKDFIQTCLCEARLMNDASGKGSDLKKMYTKVKGKYAVQTLQKKVIIEVEPQNQRYYEINDVVNIKVSVKNVSSLIVNVYAINQKNYYLLNGSEVDINMNLDGLTANYIIKKTYKENSFLLRSRTIEIKELKEKRGVFLIDILGNGRRARCLVKKGLLRYISRQEFQDENKDGDLGYVLNVIGHQNKLIKNARINLNNSTYNSDDKGNIFVPFATDNDIPLAPIILEDMRYGESSASLQFFNYRTENYSTESGLYIDRENLIESQKSSIFIRPLLFLNEQPVSCENLVDSSLLVRSYCGGNGNVGGNNKDNNSNTQKILIKKFRLSLSDKRETIVNYNIPSELRKIELTLTGKVWVGSQNKFIKLSNSSTFNVNTIDDTSALGQCVLVPYDSKYLLKILGKNGEKLGNTRVLAKCKHVYFKKLLEFKLQSNNDGVIKLGELSDIEYITFEPDNIKNKTQLFARQKFILPKNTVNIPSTITVTQGSDVLIPLITDNMSPRCDVYDENFIRIYEQVQYNAGYIKISGLPSGNFIAMIRDTQFIDVRISVSKGITCSNHNVANNRIVELSEKKSLQIVQSKGNRGNGYKIKLDGVDKKTTRVHAISSTTIPSFNAFDFLASPVSNPQIYNFKSYPIQYTPDRDVSTEEEYIYRRRKDNAKTAKNNKKSKNDDNKDDDNKDGGNNNNGQKYGNVLDPPSLLISKWSSEQDKSCNNNAPVPIDDNSDNNSQSPQSQQINQRTITRYTSVRTKTDPANLDILLTPSRCVYNLLPDKQGVVSISSDILEENHNLLTVIAIDDNNTSIKYIPLKPIKNVPSTDTRLNIGLNDKKHYSEVRRVLLKQKDEFIEFNDWPNTTLETYDDFSDIFELYYSIADKNNNILMKNNLINFKFIANWSNLNDDQKLDKYDKYGSNELNFFIFNKDKAFFKSSIFPLLSNKLQKSFFDNYLLGNDNEIKKYQRLDLYHTLNIVEKILLASVIKGKLAENTITNLKDVVSLKRDHIQEFNLLFEQALHAKQFEVTSLTTNNDNNNNNLDDDIDDNDDDDDDDNKDNNNDNKDISRQYQESRYYRVPHSDQSANLISPNAFWLDYAQHILGKGNNTGGFLSSNFGFAASSTAESLLALSIISLPFRGNQQEPTIDILSSDGNKLKSYIQGSTVKVTLNGPTMLLCRSINETQFKSSSLAVSTNYFDSSDRFEEIDFEKVDKFVNQSQFIAGKMYGCRIVITNVSSITYIGELLCQIPTGSIPVNGGFRTKNFIQQLSSYATSSLEYFFYFPKTGSYKHYPAHISRNGEVIGYSLQSTDLTVIDESILDDKTSWKYLTSSKPDVKDVVEYLRKVSGSDLRKYDLSLMSWRCADEKFFKEITNILRRKQLYNKSIWKYSLIHNQADEVREYLLRNSKFMSRLSPALTGENTGDPLFLNYNAYERKTYRHIEFFRKDENILGLFNKRIHSNNLLTKNEKFKKVYRNYLIRALYRSVSIKSMIIDDQFSGIFYLLSQNRNKQATSLYKAIDGKKAKKISPMMYDYVGIFLAFFNNDNSKALEKQDCVHKWLNVKLTSSRRKMWEYVRKQLDELKNFKDNTLSQFQDTVNAKKIKQLQPKLYFTIDVNKKTIKIKSKNIKKVVANFYSINIERLFSNKPFSAGKDALSFVQPTITQSIPITDNDKKDNNNSDNITTIPFPDKFTEKSNFVLELLSTLNNLRVAKTQYNNNLYVEFNKLRNDVFVGNFSKFPLPQAYVKVYLSTKQNPNGFFLKDGYTDLRGRFDYLTTDVQMPNDAQKVAVLVVSDKCGANIYYVDL